MNQLPKLPATWPGAVLAPFDRVFVAPIPPDTEADVRQRLAMFAGRSKEVHRTAWRFVNAIGLPRDCPRPSCRRARECASRYIACFIENRLEINGILSRLDE